MSRHDRDPGYDRGRAGRDNDRGFFDRASDEVRSWFGNDEAERRRDRDERYDDRHDDRGRSGSRGEYDVHTRRGDFDDRARYESRGGYSAERNYADRDSRTGEYRPGSYDRTSPSYGPSDRRDLGRDDRDRSDRDRGDRDRDNPRQDYLEDRYDRDYNRRYARDFGDHHGMQGRYESGPAARSGYRSEGNTSGYRGGERYDYGDRSRDDAGADYSRGRSNRGDSGRGGSYRNDSDQSDSSYGQGTGMRGNFGSPPRDEHRSESGSSRGSYASRGGYGGGRSDRYY